MFVCWGVELGERLKMVVAKWCMVVETPVMKSPTSLTNFIAPLFTFLPTMF